MWKLKSGWSSQQLYYHDCSGRIPGHTTRVPQVGFELETNGFQFYAIANLDKTSTANDGCIKQTDRPSYYIWQYFNVSNSSEAQKGGANIAACNFCDKTFSG